MNHKKLSSLYRYLIVSLLFALFVSCIPRALPVEQLPLTDSSTDTPTFVVLTATQTITSTITITPTTSATATPTGTPTITVTHTPTHTLTPTSTPTPTPDPVVRFAVIGDYGLAGRPAADVAALVKSWNPDFIITTGDNNYPDGAWETIDENIGQYYHEFIYPYQGSYGSGASENRFFPSLGNHDYYTQNAQPYFDYFELPGNQRYYDFTLGPLHLFALNSNYQEPDGISRSSIQGEWLKKGLAESDLPWKIVYMHLPPYSSGYHGSFDWVRWPFREWGASAVLSGHDHHYERLIIDGLPYFINGLGGGARYSLRDPHPGSVSRYSADWGAQLVTATSNSLTFEFFNRNGDLIDSYSIASPAAQEPAAFGTASVVP